MNLKPIVLLHAIGKHLHIL